MVPTPLQNRKYLCQAPRPELWAELSEAVLSNLGDSAVRQLTDTVQTIRALHDMQPRTGPGRKSNAEHALQFYEYLLHLATTTTTTTATFADVNVTVTTTNDSTATPSKPKQTVEEQGATDAAEETANHPADDNDIEDDSFHDAESLSMDTPTFNAQHNDLCEVCDEAGELLMCSTCNLVFHLECVRPKMDLDARPEDRQWRCSHCVLQSNQKKNSKARRQAAAAVRLMARLRKQHEWRRLNGGTTDTDTGIPITETDMDPNTETNTTLEDPEAIEESIADRNEEAVTVPVPAPTQQRSGDTTSVSAEIRMEVNPSEVTVARTDHEDTIQPESSNGAPESTPTSEDQTLPSSPPPPPPSEPVIVKRKVGRPPKKKKLPPSEIAVVTLGANQQPAAIAELRSSPARRAKALVQKTAPVMDSSILDGDDTKPAAKSSAAGVEAKPSQDEALDADASLSSKKRVSTESVNVEATTTPCSEVSSPDGRSKRCRKQPILYDPQRGPASRWQTDELKEWKASRVDEIDGKDISGIAANGNTTLDGSTTLGVTDVTADEQSYPRSARKTAQEMGDGVWCGFCKDKADVPICVFCACRVCFGKHNQTQLLLCDLCDEEYHTFCLDPPLPSVPDVKQWFCPSCKEATIVESPRSGRRAVVERVSVRSKSRDAVVAKPVEVAPSPRLARTPPTSPRKVPTTPTAQVEVRKVVTEKRPVGRPRGRPPKNQPVVVAQTVSASKKRDRSPSKVARSASEPPRKRGRPPSAATVAKRIKAEAEARKSAKLSAKVNAKTNSSLVRKAAETVTVQITKAATTVLESVSDPVLHIAVTASVVPVTISRSGRMVRRSSFHDERHEGAQHLKSGRSPSESTTMQGVSVDGITGVSTIPVTTDAVTTFGQAGRGQGTIVDEADKSDDTDAQGYSQRTIQPSEANSTLSPLKQSTLLPQHDTSFLPIGMGETSSVASRPDSTTAMSESDAGAGMFASSNEFSQSSSYRDNKQPRRKPGARECMQISRRFGVKEIPQHYIDTLNDYCTRGKVEHLIRMRERLDEHSRFLESQLAGLEALVLEHGESDIVVPLAPPSPDRRHE